MKFQLLGKTLLSELHWELGKNRYFRLGNPEQIMNVQDAKQTKRFWCHLYMAQVVLIIASFDILVSIEEKCLTRTII
jgi:hypothetical protein